jgi:hypothetical protein
VRRDLTCLLLCARRSKAGDLKEQLIWWQTPPEPAWPTREQRLDWLEHALGEARDIARGLQQHGALSAQAGHLSTYIDIVKVGRGRHTCIIALLTPSSICKMYGCWGQVM